MREARLVQMTVVLRTEQAFDLRSSSAAATLLAAASVGNGADVLSVNVTAVRRTEKEGKNDA